ALHGVNAVGYTSAGTVEFLVDEALNFYFMEINCRLQVEHTVSEETTGIDIVQEQIRIAAGESLAFNQADVVFRGHAIECRLTSEDPEHDFRPESGEVSIFLAPGGPGIRVDSHLYSGYVVPPHYDSLIAKVIAWAPGRTEAIDRMLRALDECVIDGVKTNLDFHRRILRAQSFREGSFDANLLNLV
ncbi:MAG: acetyl-CoA carboxylase biotin carboxylase subunit, partial [Chloroflexota bacterium]|nr:acetyl-CoA carboxylase biotin carboxylase subunit [Chloroflexota bacterium]